jgi:hypothetical protein
LRPLMAQQAAHAALDRAVEAELARCYAASASAARGAPAAE